jgi:hypothetical protein
MEGSNKFHVNYRNFEITCTKTCMLIKLKLAKLLRPFNPITTLPIARMASTIPKIKPGEVPEGYKAHTESSTTILVPDSNTAFLNPVQQYNRDLSIAVIRSWNEMRKEEAAAKQEHKRQKQAKGKGKGKKDISSAADADAIGEQPEAGPSKPVCPFLYLQIGLIIRFNSGRLPSWRHYQLQVYGQFDMQKKSQMSEPSSQTISRTQHARLCV